MVLTGSIGNKLDAIHQQINRELGDIERAGIAIYDATEDMLSTFVQSSDNEQQLEQYQSRLAAHPSLLKIARSGQGRIIDDLEAAHSDNPKRLEQIRAEGYRSSYTLPLQFNDQLLGFLFFDSCQPGRFVEEAVARLDVYAQLIAAMLASDLGAISTLRGAVRAAQAFGRHRDEETAQHVSRVAHYSRLIASKLAPVHHLNDEQVTFIYQFAGLHDIGKIAIPDRVLLKPTELTPEEQDIAKQHVLKGLEMADMMIDEFNLGHLPHIRMLRNIIGCHHEHYDGSGYPEGLKGDGIPIEGRIVGTADVFDALNSARPYKQAWSIGDTLAYMSKRSGREYDPDCTRVLMESVGELQEIHDRFGGRRM